MFSERMANSLSLLRRAETLALELNPEEGFFLAFSGGKDSVVVKSLCDLAGVKYRAFYTVTGVDAPDTIYFIRKYYPEVEFLHPPKKFFQLVREKGLPTAKRPWCCERTKESMGAGNVVLTGCRKSESVRRSGYHEVEICSRRAEHRGRRRWRDDDWLRQVEHKCIKGKDKVMVHPILYWPDEEVWEYIQWAKLPINPLYANHTRVGCMFCPYAQRSSVEDYERRYPKFKAALMRSLESRMEFPCSELMYSPEEYYESWKDHEPVERWVAKHRISQQG